MSIPAHWALTMFSVRCKELYMGELGHCKLIFPSVALNPLKERLLNWNPSFPALWGFGYNLCSSLLPLQYSW